MKNQIDLIQVLKNLRPGAAWHLEGNDYEGITWAEPVTGQRKPTKEEVEAEITRLQKEQDDTEYQRLRAKEYPDFKEYLDGIVKGDSAQVQSYIDKCLEVKSKYPKPGGE